jgi:hypothetical protein
LRKKIKSECYRRLTLLDLVPNKEYDIRISRNENIEDGLTFSPNDDTFDGDTELYLSEKDLCVLSWITF